MCNEMPTPEELDTATIEHEFGETANGARHCNDHERALSIVE
jgi:hypothetical protein